MLPTITSELIANAIIGIVFLMSGLGVYFSKRRPVERMDGAFKLMSEESAVVKQLARIADALEEANDDETRAFQKEMRDKFKRLDEREDYRNRQT